MLAPPVHMATLTGGVPNMVEFIFPNLFVSMSKQQPKEFVMSHIT